MLSKHRGVGALAGTQKPQEAIVAMSPLHIQLSLNTRMGNNGLLLGFPGNQGGRKKKKLRISDNQSGH